MDPPTRSCRMQAVDYLLLNDGYEGDEPMENILPNTAQSSIESFVITCCVQIVIAKILNQLCRYIISSCCV
ncbi:hypothetical protein V1504DRAFT_465496 [Lipomyces starkeyi]